MKGNVPRGIDELLHPKVDWKEALREFIKVATKGNDQSTWRRPNRRFIASGIIMPSTESHKAKCIAIGDDTSGSVSGELHAQFLGEIDLICKDVNPECIELLYWGSKVVKHETYKDSEVENLIASTKPRGGGGTEPECVPKYIMEKSIAPQCVVMLTDGYFADNDGHDEWVKLGVPVLWCVIGNTGFTPSYGQVVSISS
jgi:predicted metal-dependent peptidase